RHWGRNEKLRQVAADIVSVKNNDGSWAVAEWDNMATISAVYVWVDKRLDIPLTLSRRMYGKILSRH
ncbi:MAG: hypothetical protein ABIG61_13790, partial [Planctomycetota bacterium]